MGDAISGHQEEHENSKQYIRNLCLSQYVLFGERRRLQTRERRIGRHVFAPGLDEYESTTNSNFVDARTYIHNTLGSWNHSHMLTPLQYIYTDTETRAPSPLIAGLIDSIAASNKLSSLIRDLCDLIYNVVVYISVTTSGPHCEPVDLYHIELTQPPKNQGN